MRRSNLWCWLPVVVACAGLLWTVAGIRSLASDDFTNLWYQRHYEYLTEGFARGHLDLSLKPEAALLRLPDPYDPAQNLPYRLWDASLYQGKYYLYYGPTPALLLMLPWRLATGHVPPQWLAEGLWAVLACGGLAALIRRIAARHFPQLPGPALAFVILASIAATWLPVTLRWPSVWGLPIVAACACLWWALYFLGRFHDSNGRWGWAAGVGLSLGLLLGCRPTFLLGCVGVLAALGRGRSAGGVGGLRPLVLATGLVGAAGLGLLYYNYARFGSVTEFGQDFQLWGNQERLVRHFQPGFIPFNVGLYFFSLPQLSPFFPFVLGVWPAALPAGYIDVQEVHSILFGLPVHLLGLGALAWALRREGGAGERGLRRVLLAGAFVSFMSTGLFMVWAGATTRYLTEILAGWMPLTAVGLLQALERRGPGWRAAVRILATAAGGWSLLYALCASAGYLGLFHRTNPVAYGTVAHALNWPSEWVRRAQGREPGPLSFSVELAPFARAGSDVLVLAGRPGRAHALVLRRIDAGHASLLILENDQPTLVSAPFPTGGSVLKIGLEAPWLYPPKDHPYWDRVSAAVAADRQSRQSVTVNGAGAAGRVAHAYDATGFEPLLVTRALAPTASAWVVP